MVLIQNAVRQFERKYVCIDTWIYINIYVNTTDIIVIKHNNI
jgi:hypothetical protein